MTEIVGLLSFGIVFSLCVIIVGTAFWSKNIRSKLISILIMLCGLAMLASVLCMGCRLITKQQITIGESSVENIPHTVDVNGHVYELVEGVEKN